MIRFTAALACLSLTACFDLKVVHPGNDSYRGEISHVSLVQAIETEAGGISGTISAQSTMSQLISAPPSSALSGADVTFPPGSLAIDTSISLEESISIATDGMSAELELDTAVQTTGTPVVVQTTAKVDAQKPFSLSIPLPVGVGLALDDPWNNLVVMYRVKVELDNKTIVGVIPRAEIALENGVAKITTLYFGSFQAAVTSTPVVAKKEVLTQSVVLTKQESKDLPALAITGRAPFVAHTNKVIEIRGSNFRPSMMVALGGKKVGNLQILSDSKASFLAPSSGSFGLSSLAMEQDGVAQSVSIFYAAGAYDYPVITDVETEVCEGKKYYDATGEVRTGRKVCSLPNCAGDNAIGCVANTAYPAVDKSALQGNAGQWRSSFALAGVAGTLPDCSSDGGTGCVAVAAYPAAKLSGSAAKILSGQSVAGINGSAAVKPADCDSDGDLDCVAVADFPAADKSGAAAKILTGQNLAGISGSAALRPANCSSDNGTNCVAVAAFPSVVKANITAGVVKKNTVIAGVTGDYPSSTYRLADADSTDDLDTANFNIKIKSAASFEWFDSTGARYTGIGDVDLAGENIKNGVSIFNSSGTYGPDCLADGLADCLTNSRYKSMDTDASVISTWDIRSGKTAGGISGSLKFYKNLAKLSTHNRSTGAAADANAFVADVYDTIDDYNNALGFPTDLPPGFEMPGSNWLRDPASDIDSSGTCNGAEACVVIDRITGLAWSKDDGSPRNLETAISYCDGLNYGSYSDWRLPTQKELLQVYTDAVLLQKAPLNLVNTMPYLSSTTDSFSVANAWSVAIGKSGAATSTAKSGSFRTICVR